MGIWLAVGLGVCVNGPTKKEAAKRCRGIQACLHNLCGHRLHLFCGVCVRLLMRVCVYVLGAGGLCWVHVRQTMPDAWGCCGHEPHKVLMLLLHCTLFLNQLYRGGENLTTVCVQAGFWVVVYRVRVGLHGVIE